MTAFDYVLTALSLAAVFAGLHPQKHRAARTVEGDGRLENQTITTWENE